MNRTRRNDATTERWRRSMTCGLVASLVLFSLLLSPSAAADETTPRTAHKLTLEPGALDLLPHNDIEREDFQRKHGALVRRVQALGKSVRSLDGKIKKQQASRAKAKNKKKIDAELKKLTQQRRKLRVQLTAVMGRLTDELVKEGMHPALIPLMNGAATGPQRIERHSYKLALMAPDLSADQWDLLVVVIERIEGALDALAAQQERTTLALKQAELSGDQRKAITGTFDQQRRLIDKRFWLLIDFTLDDDQRAAIWKILPGRFKRKTQAKEHLFLLSDLSPSQMGRLRALTTEAEQESAPDTAAVQRVRRALQDKTLKAPERKVLSQERSAAYKRLSELRRFAATEIKKVLTEDQYHEYLSIPPRLSTNDRRATQKQVFQGFKPSPEQQAALKRLTDEARIERRDQSREMADLRRKSAEYGPDSPQMMGMRMAMEGARSDGARLQREITGRVFLEVLTLDEACRWVLGHWGYKR